MNPAQSLAAAISATRKSLVDFNLQQTLDAVAEGRRRFSNIFDAQLWLTNLNFVPVISDSPLDVIGARFSFAGIIWGDDGPGGGPVDAAVVRSNDLPLEDLKIGRAKIFGARSAVADFGRPIERSTVGTYNDVWSHLQEDGIDTDEISQLWWNPKKQCYFVSYGDWVETPKDEREQQMRGSLGENVEFADETESGPPPDEVDDYVTLQDSWGRRYKSGAGDKPGHAFHGNQWVKKPVSTIGPDEDIPPKGEVLYHGKTYVTVPNSTYQHAKYFHKKQSALAHTTLLNALHPDKNHVVLPLDQKNLFTVGHLKGEGEKIITNKVVPLHYMPPAKGEEIPILKPAGEMVKPKTGSEAEFKDPKDFGPDEEIPPFAKVKYGGKLLTLSPNSMHVRAKLFKSPDDALERAKIQDAKSGSGSHHIVVPIPQKNMFAVGRIMASWAPESHPGDPFKNLAEQFTGKKLGPPPIPTKLVLTGNQSDKEDQIKKYISGEPKKKPAPPPPHEPHFEKIQPLVGGELTKELGKLPPAPAGAAPAQTYNTKELSELADTISAKIGVTKTDMLKALSRHADPSQVKTQQIRAATESAILKTGSARKNAVLLLNTLDDAVERTALIKSLSGGNEAHRAVVEYAETPIYDLQCLGGISVINMPVHGQANCNILARKVNMGSTSVTGDFRHELGHAVQSALSGGPGLMNKTAMTKACADHYQSVKDKIAANPAGTKSKLSHEWFEDNYGVISSRGLDNWMEDFAEHYRGYHKLVYMDAHATMYSDYVSDYRKKHLAMAKLWDAHYTAALLGALYKRGEIK